MTKPYKNLRERMSSTAKEKATAKAQIMIKNIDALKELREARKYSQVRLAEVLNTSQANVSKIERRTDIYISTLRGFIEGMGGKLEILASFPDGKIRIEQFQDLDFEAE
ncbi:MAG: helix-turn-helix domain-containing protein [Candidatus Omnitrophota bacterium]|jgi:transcriptional regulator with XRE-family HTH domain|nr:MAG: helix-turn-helix domain-containing protein [Candidatus Omnitrophota bacterium]